MISNQKITFFLLAATITILPLVLAAPGSSISVDDNLVNTSSKLQPFATFTGHTLTVINGSTNSVYNLTKQGGTLLDNTTGNGTLDTSGYEGVAKVKNSSSTKQIHIIQPDHDVAGRVQLTANMNSPTITNVTLYDFYNNSQLDADEYNYTYDNAWSSQSALFRLNVSRDKYFLGIETQEATEGVKIGRGVDNTYGGFFSSSVINESDFPRITDIKVGQANITGQLTYTNGTGISGVTIEAERRVSNQKREPLMRGPPTYTTTTNGTGHYEFINVTVTHGKDSYYLAIENNTIGRESRTDFFPDIQGLQNGNEETVDMNATDTTIYNVTVDFDAANKDSKLYAVGIFSKNISGNIYVDIKTTPSEFSFPTVQNGTYEVLGAVFQKGGNTNPTFDVFPDAQINTDKNYTVSFADRVRYYGVVNDSQGNAVENARVLLENTSENAFSQGITNANGTFNISVEDQTGYNVRVEPPFNSNYQTTETTTSIDGNTENNFTLTDGNQLTGQIQNNQGQGVEASVEVWNSSQSSFQFDTTNETGFYNITGLSSTSYNVEIYPYNPNYGITKKTIDLSGDTQKNFTLGDNNVNFTVEVTNGTDPLQANISIENYDGTVSRRNTTNSSGAHLFKDIGGKTGYQVQINPADNSYEEKTQWVYLTGNEKISVTLTKPTTLSGYVTDANTNVSNVEVLAYNQTLNSFDFTTTDNNGKYELDIQEAGHDVTVAPGGEGKYSPTTKNVAKQNITNNDEVNFSLSSGVNVTGYIQTDTNNNLTGDIGVWNESEGSASYQTFQGSYEFSGLKNTTYNVRVSPDNETFDTKITTLDTANDQVNFTFETSKDGRKVEVTVKEKGASTLENATVGMKRWERLTDSNGQVTFPQQTVGEEVEIVADKEDYKPTRKTLTIQNQTVQNSLGTETEEYHNITLELESIRDKRFDVDTTLEDQNSKSVSAASIVVRDQNSSLSRSAVTDSNGEATLNDVITSNYTIGAVTGKNKFGTNTTEINKSINTSIQIDINGKTHTLNLTGGS